MNIRYAHYKTLNQTIATLQPSNPEYQEAITERRRRARKKCRKRKYHYCNYRRKYGMSYKELIEFLSVSQTTITVWERKGILGHHIRLEQAKRPKVRKLRQG